MTDEFPRNAQLPRVIISLKSVTPRGQSAQSGLAPGGGANVHDGRISAAQYGREIDDSPPQPLAEPRCALMAPVIDPLRFRPFVRASRKHHRSAVIVSKLAGHAQRSRIFVLAPRQ